MGLLNDGLYIRIMKTLFYAKTTGANQSLKPNTQTLMCKLSVLFICFDIRFITSLSRNELIFDLLTFTNYIIAHSHQCFLLVDYVSFVL